MRICVINPFAGTEFFGRENLEAVAAPGTEFDMVDIGERYPLTNNQWLFFKHSCTGPTIDRAIEADYDRLLELIVEPTRVDSIPLRENPELLEIAKRLPRLQAERQRLEDPPAGQQVPAPGDPP